MRATSAAATLENWLWLELRDSNRSVYIKNGFLTGHIQPTWLGTEPSGIIPVRPTTFRQQISRWAPNIKLCRYIRMYERQMNFFCWWQENRFPSHRFQSNQWSAILYRLRTFVSDFYCLLCTFDFSLFPSFYIIYPSRITRTADCEAKITRTPSSIHHGQSRAQHTVQGRELKIGHYWATIRFSHAAPIGYGAMLSMPLVYLYLSGLSLFPSISFATDHHYMWP